MRKTSYKEFGDDEEVRAVHGATLYITTRERNAWHGYESKQYRGPASLTTSLDEAKRVAENWRAQGSGFSIQQVPALIITSDSWRVALTEFHTDASFSDWTGRFGEVLQHGWPLTHTLDALGPEAMPGSWKNGAPSHYSFVSGIVDTDEELEPLRNRFKAWSSFSHGGRYMLGWFDLKGRHKARGVRAILRQYEEINKTLMPEDVASLAES